ncbi:MAG: uridine diphosphate-N-acetylglucosamine-binding protein YvcK [Erysipelotrichaceae bacterium]|nr:uridine diphosphate-N-acetylglucosamine-binding protein YvcK [Erysipelotrichaceae bacterium]MDY5252939.1 uridine diphosphate-N-acetylglucosamine-binding protein YvcK [Erysipelotrichaceae bacterium]
MKNKQVVVIGGGHGLSTILRGIKHIDNIDITAIVTVADDGGSTGRLRRQFHIPAMGDIRNVLLSLAQSESLLSNLMDYRFESNLDPDKEDEDIQGHNLGNLILTAMTQTCGSFMEAITTCAEVLNVKGKIVPSTLQVVTLYAMMEDKTIVKGEANIPNFDNRILKVFYDCDVKATPAAVTAIKKADLIIFGIGSLYTSILPNVIIPKIQEALRNTKAKKLYFCNVMSQPGETDGYSVEDHVDALHLHKIDIDEVVIASDKIPETIIERYHQQGSNLVKVCEDKHPYQLCYANLLDFNSKVIRHNSLKIKKFVEDYIGGL